MNSGKIDSRNNTEGDNIEYESERDFLAYLEVNKGKRRKKISKKKIRSQLDIKNKIISEVDRRRRDKALKRRNWNKQYLEETELSGKSLSDSDINNRVSKILFEVKHVLNMSKKIGVNFLGDENDVLKDLVDIEINEGR
ncbi:hypothetical protein V6N13_067166 [Hibiscus sabdariffa]